MIIATIEQSIEELSKSERRVADYVLTRPNIVARSSINDIAEGAEVSEPTVIRFCRTVGCKGFQDLKQQISRDMGRMTPVSYHADGPGAFELATRHFDRTLSAFFTLQSELDKSALDAAAHILSEAKQYFYWGSGRSGYVAHDAAHAMAALGRPSSAISDGDQQQDIAQHISPDTAIIAISEEGARKDLLAACGRAKTQGAKLIAITQRESALAALGDAVIEVMPIKDRSVFSPSTTRLLQHFVLDLLQARTAMEIDLASSQSVSRYGKSRG